MTEPAHSALLPPHPPHGLPHPTGPLGDLLTQMGVAEAHRAGWHALVAAVILGPVGTVLGVRVLRATPAGDPNRGLAAAAVVVGVVHTLLVLAVIVLGVWVAVWAAGWATQQGLAQ